VNLKNPENGGSRPTLQVGEEKTQPASVVSAMFTPNNAENLGALWVAPVIISTM
jgi:hypothetical protein